MAIVLRTHYLQNTPSSTEAVIYVDSINKDSYVAEMYNLCIKYIREKMDIFNTQCVIFKRENFMACDEKNIYNDKQDGFWIIADEKERIVTLYKRITYRGRWFYDSTYIEKIFTLTCQECSKIVPKVFKKSTLYDNFTQELTMKVSTFRDRTNTLKI
jgi:hypothetical protein